MDARRIRVRGQVQGVGFRPFIWQLARAHGVKGHVLNDPEGVLIHAEGEALDAFEADIAAKAPPLARVDAVEGVAVDAQGATEFTIAKSTGQGAETRVTPDAATCAACLAEIRDPDDRRAGYAFANCTHCGPRFTILRALPYDRAQTTMAPFEMCAACRAEYEDPADRRFHAQPVACPDCGPRVWVEAGGQEQAFTQAAERLRAGEILAIKGLGGFHLACDATNEAAVALLRTRKYRPGKPFALMGTEATIARYATPTDAEWAVLRDPAAPILLLALGTASLAPSVAPGQARLGWMLPYTPLHHLLFDAFDGPLVMTSGNLSGEPQVIGNDEARAKLATFADAFVMHDREIVRRLDDSVERITPQGPMILRRARGRVPGTLPLPPGFEEAPQVLAFGGQMKSAICLTKNNQALLSHHLGDLDDALTYDAFRQAEEDYTHLFDHKATVVAVDLHPGYRATQHGMARAGDRPVIEVQHHHAHLAACLADAGWPLGAGPVAGIILDGLGLGSDGTIWGGEVLLGDYAGFERAAWLRPVPLPGGDAANREPWRNLLARLDAAGLGALADEMLAHQPRDLMRQAMAAGVNAPLSSSAGRLFDAFSAALGLVTGAMSYEAEAAMRLEALALDAPPEEAAYPYVFGFDAAGGALDDTTLWDDLRTDLRAGVPPETIALRFHAGVASSFATQARRLVDSGAAQAVALSGGCFQNALLLDLTLRALDGLPVLHHRSTPANDGGLALGQALIAAAAAMESN
ncbi:MAG: carbamoyltransferase HypF [Rhodobacteraceae bacterium]|nr:carbamoyltransferase HypF [Paracoccaceae bacterium]